MWSAEGERLGILAGHSDRVQDAHFSPDGSTLATCSDDGSVMLWNVATRLPLFPIGRELSAVEAVRFSHDGRTLVAAGQQTLFGKEWRSVYLWSLGNDAADEPPGDAASVDAIAGN